MTQTTLYLIRHTEPAVRGICYGALDVPLSAGGLAHAQTIAAELAGEKFATIYTSPLRRCFDLARILGEGRTCPLETVAALRELDFGRFEGRTYEDLARDYPDVYARWMESPTEVEFPGGESFTIMRTRVLAAARKLQLRHAGESVAVVTHGGVIRILLAEAQCLDPRRIFEIDVPYGPIRRVALPWDPASPPGAPADTTPRPR